MGGWVKKFNDHRYCQLSLRNSGEMMSHVSISGQKHVILKFVN